MNGQINTADYSLITQERAQKLDLVTHLIANSTQSLVVCGPKGIGKTMLIKLLLERKNDAWQYSALQGSPDLSFENILEQIADAVKTGKSGQQPPSLDRFLAQLESQGDKLVLIIDDAGQLVPGLITALIDYAAANPALRITFALTPDEVYIKTRSDRIIDDCYFVEIPLLSEKQCGDFLQQLSAKSWIRLPVNTLSDSIIESVYRETQGIPERIIAQIPSLAITKKRDKALWLLIAAVVALVSIALGVQWLSSSGYLQHD
ncbi:MAG: ATP-binding protein [Methylovulum sp.]|nr:ATP-binding protein [Methylovulum sp.]